jgi:hypothetical protein
VGHGQDQHTSTFNPVDEIVRNPPSAELPHATTDLGPHIWVLRQARQPMLYVSSQPIPKSEYPLLQIGCRSHNIFFGFGQKKDIGQRLPNRDRTRASASAADTGCVSPAR